LFGLFLLPPAHCANDISARYNTDQPFLFVDNGQPFDPLLVQDRGYRADIPVRTGGDCGRAHDLADGAPFFTDRQRFAEDMQENVLERVPLS
jgi:hypothetical protein